MKNTMGKPVRSVLLLLGIVASTGMLRAGQASKLEVQKLNERVYALVGQRGPMSKWNFGTNATFGVIVTDKGVVLIDPGASDKAARYIHAAIRKITDQPVVMVINTGSEDLRWLGNSYFRSQGARIITSHAALKDQKARASEQLGRLENLISEKYAAGTVDSYADETFERQRELRVGGTKIVLYHPGPAYLPGDSYVWLPKEKVVFTGDIVSTERMLAVARASNTASWIDSFRRIEKLKPRHVVPGHGHATDMATARADTLDYLLALRKAVREYIDNGGAIEAVSSLNQYPLSSWERLIGYDMLMGRNALHVYMEMEWE